MNHEVSKCSRFTLSNMNENGSENACPRLPNKSISLYLKNMFILYVTTWKILNWHKTVEFAVNHGG